MTTTTPPAKLEIVYARYEALHDPDPISTRYVTLQLQALIQNNKLLLKNEFNRYFGDPCPGVPKQLVIAFRVNNNRQVELKWIEGGAFVNVHAADFITNKPVMAAARSKAQQTAGGFPLFGNATASSQPPQPPLEDAFPHEALPVMMSFLPVFPDRLSCILVCREWKNSLSNSGLTEEFRMRSRSGGSGGNNYLDQPCAFVSLIVSKSQSSLRILDLAGYTKLTDSALLDLLSMNLPRLAVLDLTDCVQLTDESVKHIAVRCRNLRALTLKRLNKLTDESLAPIVTNCVLLERLDLSQLSNLTDCTAQNLPNLVHLRALFLRENHRVTNAGMREFFSRDAGQDHRLKELSLWGLHRLTFPGNCFGFAHLRSLTLEGCINLDDDAVGRIADSCGEMLLSLSFKYCHKLSDRAIQHVANKLPLIQHLNLAYVCRITDQGLECLSTRLGDLRSLDLSHCFKLSAPGIYSAVARLPMLSELKLRACNKQGGIDAERLVAGESSISLLDLRDCGEVTQQPLSGFVNYKQQGCFIKEFRL